MIRVETHSSVYLIDLQQSRIQRQTYLGNDLRRDGEWIRMLSWNRPTVGQPMMLTLDLVGDGTVTIRFTTPVTSLTSAEGR